DVKSLFPLFVPILSCSPPLPLKEGIWDRSLYQFFFGALYHFISGGDKCRLVSNNEVQRLCRLVGVNWGSERIFDDNDNLINLKSIVSSLQ
ncbi:MAG: hypothetical protein K0M45_01610, partial [Candidatus Paracaedibacteraceae bacterium]|nr:hypothetical protein [Candidatus Paracaedibacteraceae bacterium]